MIGFASILLEIVLLASPAILAIVFWRRCPAAAGLVFSGTCVVLLAFFAHLFVPQIVTPLVFAQWGDEGLRIVCASVPFVCGVIHAIGLGLLFAAVLVGRSPVP